MSKLVLPYKPRLVVVYAGENDLAGRRRRRRCWPASCVFVEGVRKTFGDPHRLRVDQAEPVPGGADRAGPAANALIEAYSAVDPNLDYIDVFSKMLGADGQPRPSFSSPTCCTSTGGVRALAERDLGAPGRLG
jgi:hypothetical protein